MKQPRGFPGVASVDSVSVARSLAQLEPRGVFVGKKGSSVSLRTVRQQRRGGGNYPAYTWWLNHGRRRFWLFTRTPVEWGALGRPNQRRVCYCVWRSNVTSEARSNSSPGDHTLFGVTYLACRPQHAMARVSPHAYVGNLYESLRSPCRLALPGALESTHHPCLLPGKSMYFHVRNGL